MNERIRELAKIAQIETSKSFADRWDGVPRAEFMAAYNQKFAELIVGECALQCVHNEDMDRIEKHFGVE